LQQLRLSEAKNRVVDGGAGGLLRYRVRIRHAGDRLPVDGEEHVTRSKTGPGGR
jgi:hypothetical protein